MLLWPTPPRFALRWSWNGRLELATAKVRGRSGPAIPSAGCRYFQIDPGSVRAATILTCPPHRSQPVSSKGNTRASRTSQASLCRRCAGVDSPSLPPASVTWSASFRPDGLQRKGDMLRIQDLQTPGVQGRPNDVAAQLLQSYAIGGLNTCGRVQREPTRGKAPARSSASPSRLSATNQPAAPSGL